MESIDIGRRKAMGTLAATAVLAAGATIPIKALADVGPQDWPLWAIRKGGKTIYLTGETKPRPTDWHDDRIERLLTQCSSLWTETNQVYKQPQGELMNRLPHGGAFRHSRSRQGQKRLAGGVALRLF